MGAWVYYTCPRRLGTICPSLARGMRHRHMIILKSTSTTYIYYDY
jgi:hypothetical protein